MALSTARPRSLAACNCFALIHVLAAASLVFVSGSAPASDESPDRIVRQPEGKVVYWVLPGPRQLGAEVFGTPDAPKSTLAPKLEEARHMVERGEAPPSVPQLLKDLPILVGVPLEARSEDENGNWWLREPNPFPDDARIVQGRFEAKYWDHVAEDPPGPPGKTPDHAEMEAEFSDPEGNRYRVVLDHVVKPPFPGYETDGGVMLDDVHHGTTGTGSPLMPQVWTIAALWGVGEIHVNGEKLDSLHVVHMMTTEVVRDTDYHLALQEELPLPPERWHVKGQAHHTHLVVLPVVPRKGGPVFQPLETAFTLPNGQPQPFVHVMFEQDEVRN